jgi:hypothetical protein
MDLANIRQNGVRSVDVICYGCRPQVVINVEKITRRAQGALVRPARGLHEVRNDRSRCAAELAGKAALSKPPIQIPFILAVLFVMNAQELFGLGRPESLSFGPERTEE